MDKATILAAIKNYEIIEERADEIAKRVGILYKIYWLHTELDIGEENIDVWYDQGEGYGERIAFPTSYLWDKGWEEKEKVRVLEHETKKLRRKWEELDRKLRIIFRGDEEKYLKEKEKYVDKYGKVW